MGKKFLIIRLSSFGDIVQSLSVVQPIKQSYPDAQIDWVVRSDFYNVLQLTNGINKIWSVDRGTGLKGLLSLCKQIKNEQYDYIFDAHSNLRSYIIKTSICKFWRFRKKVITRSKSRIKRFFLFRFGINFFPKPYRGMISYQMPLKSWGILPSKKYFEESTVPFEISNKVVKMLDERFSNKRPLIALVPSAAWKMKRWPLSYWKRLIKILPGYNFIVLGGPGDSFCRELESDVVYNVAGKTSLIESCAIVACCDFTISADTGLLHVADFLGKRAIALIGPTAFGFPTGRHVKVVEASMACRPCSKDGRGRCSHSVYQKCMIDLTPERVANCIRQMQLISDL